MISFLLHLKRKKAWQHPQAKVFLGNPLALEEDGFLRKRLCLQTLERWGIGKGKVLNVGIISRWSLEDPPCKSGSFVLSHPDHTLSFVSERGPRVCFLNIWFLTSVYVFSHFSCFQGNPSFAMEGPRDPPVGPRRLCSDSSRPMCEWDSDLLIYGTYLPWVEWEFGLARKRDT